MHFNIYLNQRIFECVIVTLGYIPFKYETFCVPSVTYIMKWLLKKWVVRVWTGFICLRKRSSARLL